MLKMHSVSCFLLSNRGLGYPYEVFTTYLQLYLLWIYFIFFYRCICVCMCLCICVCEMVHPPVWDLICVASFHMGHTKIFPLLFFYHMSSMLNEYSKLGFMHVPFKGVHVNILALTFSSLDENRNMSVEQNIVRNRLICCFSLSGFD